MGNIGTTQYFLLRLGTRDACNETQNIVKDAYELRPGF